MVHWSESEGLRGTSDQKKNCKVYTQNISILAIQPYLQPLMSRVIILKKNSSIRLLSKYFEALHYPTPNISHHNHLLIIK